MKQKFTLFKTKERISQFGIPVLIITLIYLVGISSIIRADYDYIDDMGRISQGYLAWSEFGRYLSDFLSTLIHTRRYMSDISPLTQTIACAVVATAAVILLYTFTNRTRFSVYEYIAATILALNPYFLECLSYKFDSPFMALSILGAVFPILFRCSKPIIYFLSVFIGTLVVCTTYQAALGIFPIIVIFVIFDNWNSKKYSSKNDLVQFVLYSALPYVIAILVFRFFLMKSFGEYVDTSIPNLKDFVPNFFANLNLYYSCIFSDFKKSWLILIGLLIVSLIYVLLKGSRQNVLLAFFALVVCILMSLLLCFGVYPIFTDSIFVPRAMYGFSTFLAVASIMVARGKEFKIEKLVPVCLSWVFFVFCFTYGNALAAQDSYTESRAKALIADLNTLDSFKDGPCAVQLDGSIGLAPSVQNTAANCKVLEKLVPQTLSSSYWFWGGYRLYYYYGLDIGRNVEIDMTQLDYDIVLDSPLHTIKSDGAKNFLVILK